MAQTPETPTFRAALEAVVMSRAPKAQVEWFSKALPREGEPFARGKFFGAYAGCGRRLKGASPLKKPELALLRENGAAVPEAHTVVDLARTALLLRGLSVVGREAGTALFKETYQKGDSGEQVSTLRALCFLPHPSDFLEAAIDATRTNVVEVFAALACDNSYPAEHFPDLHFNQLVMKALFLEVPLSQVDGLKGRVTSELVRMASDYASERSAAGREVPADIALILAAPPSAG